MQSFNNMYNDDEEAYHKPCRKEAENMSKKCQVVVIRKPSSIKKPKLDIKKKLSKASNISSWSCNDVHNWLIKTCLEFGLPRPFPVEKFIMNGKAINLLSKEDFINRCPSYGDILYYALAQFKSGISKKILQLIYAHFVICLFILKPFI
jgi:hypothetical protein